MQVRQIEHLITHLRDGIGKHFERHTAAVVASHTPACVPGQGIVQFFRDASGAAGALEGVPEAVELLVGIGDAESIGIAAPPLRSSGMPEITLSGGAETK